VLWTDWSYAALDFNIFLTGYDVPGDQQYDIFNRGIIAPGAIPGVTGSTSGTDVRTTAPSLAVGNPVNATPATPNATANPNFITTAQARSELSVRPAASSRALIWPTCSGFHEPARRAPSSAAGCTTRLGASITTQLAM